MLSSFSVNLLVVLVIRFKMSWNPHMEVHYNNISYPYSTAGSFIEYFEGLTYEHVNFIFSGASHAQESSYPSTSSFYKFGLCEPDNTSYFRYNHGYEVNYHETLVDEYRRPPENSTTVSEHTAAVSTEWGEDVNTAARDNSVECPRRHHSNSNDYQVIWQDSIDPDNMSYEELLELGEAVGTQGRGLTPEQISLLPVSKYKCGFFLRKKSRDERKPIKVNRAYASSQRGDTSGYIFFLNASRGFGFVSFRNQQDAQSAINDLTGLCRIFVYAIYLNMKSGIASHTGHQICRKKLSMA